MRVRTALVVFRMADRLDAPAWHASVRRTLGAADNLYDKMEGVAGERRLETLEWVIIILILISIVPPFTPFYHERPPARPSSSPGPGPSG